MILILGYDATETSIHDFLRHQGLDIHHTADKIALADYDHYDFVISFGYRHIITTDIIEHYGERIINIHNSLLPYNRGVHANFWAIHDDTPKGITIHLVSPGLDEGDILFQKSITFTTEEDTFSATYNRLRQEQEMLFKQVWPDLYAGNFTRTPQDPQAGSIHYTPQLEQYQKYLTEGWDTKISDYKNRLSTTTQKSDNVL